MKKVIFTLVFTLMLISCGTTGLVKKAQQLELGMTKKEVISLMGNNYRIVTASQTPRGNMEVLRYDSDLLDATEYVLYILDGKLVEWHEDRPEAENEHPRKHHHKGKHHEK